METLTANAFVTSRLAFLYPEQTVFDAYNEMQKRQVRHLPVLEKGVAVGMISDRDLQFIHDHADGKEILCKDIMTSEPFVVSTEEPIVNLAKQMVERRINSALINNSEGKIVGIFTSTDALKLLADFNSK